MSMKMPRAAALIREREQMQPGDTITIASTMVENPPGREHYTIARVDCGTEEAVIQIRTIDPEPRNSIDPQTGEYRMLIPCEEISREEFALRYPPAEPQGISGLHGKLPDDWAAPTLPEADERGNG